MRVGFVIDLFLVVLSACLALYLRENFSVSAERLQDFLPYLVATVLAACIVIPLSRINRLIWRFSSFPDYVRATVAAFAITIIGLAVAFSYNRLDGVARSLPVLQFMMSVFLLVGARVAVRFHTSSRKFARQRQTPLKIAETQPVENVLIVGLNRLTETYLESLNEFGVKHIHVAGLLGRKERHIGRLASMVEVIGVPEEIEAILNRLELHGLSIDRIIISTPFSRLSEEARAALLRVEREGSIKLRYVAETLELVGERETRASGDAIKANSLPGGDEVRFEIARGDIEQISRRRYWAIKRLIDFTASLILIVALAPVMLVVAALVALELGVPVAFWQQRPGLGGRPFKLTKFRSMAPAHARNGRRLSDEERTSKLGDFLRRTRLDELPQLFNILRGDMSFIGPRPLLPRDQSDAYKARLLVRPGLTGWAQVVGGRTITAEDKAALDVWYVRNASLALDFEIALRTIPMIVYGEQVHLASIRRAWDDLERAGVLRGRETDTGAPQLRAAS